MCDCVWMVWTGDCDSYHNFCGAYSTPQGALNCAGRVMLEERELTDKAVFELVQNNTEYLAIYYCDYFDEYIYVERVLLDDDH